MTRDLLLFTDHFPYGTSEPFLASELPYLRKAFRSVTIIPIDTSRDSFKRPVPDGINVWTPPYANFKSKILLLWKGITGQGNTGMLFRELLASAAWKSPGKLRHWLTVFLLIRTYLPLFKRVTDSFSQPENIVLYFYWGQRWSQIIPSIPLEFKDIIVRMHGSDLYEELYDGYIPFRYQQLSRVSRIFTISEYGKEYLTKSYPEFSNKIVVARLGTEDHGLNPMGNEERNSFTLVSCGSLTPTKRVALIAKVLNHSTLSVRWHHFGDGPEKTMVKMACEDLPENVTVEFHGYVSQKELFDFYSESPVDLFINVSSSEGVPVSIMEALSFGIPVVATDVGGTGELVNQSNGILIPKEFVASETGALIDSLVQTKSFENMRISARETWSRLADTSVVYPEFITKLTAGFNPE